MRNSFEFDTADEALAALSRFICGNHENPDVEEINSRAGRVREMAYVGVGIRSPLDRGFLLPGRKANLAAQIAETMWVLAGRNDVEWLAHYLPRAPEFSDDGRTWRGGYGPRLRNWKSRSGGCRIAAVDQFAYVTDLLARDPSTRRAVMTIYDPEIDSQPGKDIPCNNWLHFQSRQGFLSLHVATRSNDLIWGWSGINFFEWSALLEIMAGLQGLLVGELHFSISSLHVYDRHWDKALRMGWAGIPLRAGEAVSPAFTTPHELQTSDERLIWFADRVGEWFEIEEAIRKGDSPEAQVEDFPEPMMQSWLRVLQWWWTGDEKYLEPLVGTRLGMAARAGVQPKIAKPLAPVDEPGYDDAGSGAEPGPTRTGGTEMQDFYTYVQSLHAEKHAAYGDSWRKRGEIFSILPNIARKLDRLGRSDSQETAADTAIDLLVYLVKYRVWLAGEADTVENFNRTLQGLQEIPYSVPDTAMRLRGTFEYLLDMAQDENPNRSITVAGMSRLALGLARHEWWKLGNEKRPWKGYEG